MLKIFYYATGDIAMSALRAKIFYYATGDIAMSALRAASKNLLI